MRRVSLQFGKKSSPADAAKQPDDTSRAESPTNVGNNEDEAQEVKEVEAEDVDEDEEARWKEEDGDYFDYYPEVLPAVDLGKLKAFTLALRKKQLAQKASPSLTCKIVGREEGNTNIVFVIKFSDGVRWVARIPGYGKNPTVKQRKKMASEYTTMQYIEQQTTFPLPHVHYWTTNPSKINVAFALVSYVEGRPLYWLVRHNRNFNHQKRLTVLSDYAEHMNKLYMLQFPSAGDLQPKNIDEDQIASRVSADAPAHLDLAAGGPPKTFQQMLEDTTKEIEGMTATSWSKQALRDALLKLLGSTPGYMRNAPLTLSIDPLLVSVHVDAETGHIKGFLGQRSFTVKPAHLGSAAYPFWLRRRFSGLEFNYSVGGFATSKDALDEYRKHYVKCWKKFNEPGLGVKYDPRWTKDSPVIRPIWDAVEMRDSPYEDRFHQQITAAYDTITQDKQFRRTWPGIEDVSSISRFTRS